MCTSRLPSARRPEHTLTAYLLHDIHAGRNLWQRLIHAGGLLRKRFRCRECCSSLRPWPLPCATASSAGWCCWWRFRFRFVWALGFSYDLRNIALAVPLVRRGRWNRRGESGRSVRAKPQANGGAGSKCQAGTRGVWNIARARVADRLCRVAAGCVGVLLGMRFGRDELIARHLKLQETIGMSNVSGRSASTSAIMDRGSYRHGLPRHAWPPGVGQYACRVPRTRWRNFGSPMTGRT